MEHPLTTLCHHYGIHTLYAFGSQAKSVQAWLADETITWQPHSDIDIGYKSHHPLSLEQKTRFTLDLEDILNVSRVDLIDIAQADPFLAANIIRGERLYTEDEYLADEYVLYILRRVGDLAYHEQKRLDSVLGITR